MHPLRRSENLRLVRLIGPRVRPNPGHIAERTVHVDERDLLQGGRRFLVAQVEAGLERVEEILLDGPIIVVSDDRELVGTEFSRTNRIKNMVVEVVVPTAVGRTGEPLPLFAFKQMKCNCRLSDVGVFRSALEKSINGYPARPPQLVAEFVDRRMVPFSARSIDKRS